MLTAEEDLARMKKEEELELAALKELAELEQAAAMGPSIFEGMSQEEIQEALDREEEDRWRDEMYANLGF